MTPPEWNSTNLTCGTIPENGFEVLRLDRFKMGRHLQATDYMLIYLTRRNGKVFLSSIDASYLPMLTSQLDADLAACPDLSMGQAQTSIVRHEFVYSLYNLCIYISDGRYVPNSYDMVRFDSERLGICGDTYWKWSESFDRTGVVFQKVQRGVLEIGRANVDQKLLRSDLNCPVTGSTTARIFGYELEWDALEGVIVNAKPGIGCIVC
ncbi:MAG: hypothetical protein U0136_22055 [Bdellovibrionota bacterium]